MRTEKALVIVILIGLVFKFLLHLPGSSFMLVISLSAASMLYFAGAYYFFCDKITQRQNHALTIFSGAFLSVIPIGILFKIMYWPGGQFYLLIGIVTAPIFFAIAYLLKSKSTEDLKIYYKNMLWRTSVLTVLSGLFYLTSVATLLRVQYSDDAELGRLKALHYTNPDNKEFTKQLDDYLFKRDSLKHNKTGN